MTESCFCQVVIWLRRTFWVYVASTRYMPKAKSAWSRLFLSTLKISEISFSVRTLALPGMWAKFPYRYILFILQPPKLIRNKKTLNWLDSCPEQKEWFVHQVGNKKAAKYLSGDSPQKNVGTRYMSRISQYRSKVSRYVNRLLAWLFAALARDFILPYRTVASLPSGKGVAPLRLRCLQLSLFHRLRLRSSAIACIQIA